MLGGDRKENFIKQRGPFGRVVEGTCSVLSECLLLSCKSLCLQRMRTEYNCAVMTGKPKVAFRESIGKEIR